MNKITIQLIIALVLLPAISLFSQNETKFTFYEDFFDLETLPEGWSVLGEGQENWSISNYIYAGGEVPEVILYWDEQFEGTSRLVTPIVNTEGLTEIVLEFKHSFSLYEVVTDSVKIETTSDGGVTWNEVWAHLLVGDIAAETKILNITTPDVGSTNFQVAFTFVGNSYNINDWNIDDVSLGDLFTHDAIARKILIEELINGGSTVTPSGLVKNFGSVTITFDAIFIIVKNGTTIYTETVPVTDLAYNETATVTFTDWTAIEGEYEAFLTVDLNGDENPDNDEISKEIEVINGLVYTKPLFQVFTSSTCGPCLSGNQVMDSVLANNPDDSYSLIKYQTNWPAPGDPYTIEEVVTRVDYYGVEAVPSLYTFDSERMHPYYFTQELFNEYSIVPTAMNIAIETATINTDNTVELITTINVVSNYDAGLKLHIAVVEKMTTGNVGNNGETEFHNVLMKMLPDAEGTTLDELTVGNPVTFTQSYDMNQTFMEEATNLAAVVFIQDDSNKNILQSEMIDVTYWTEIKNNSLTQNTVQLFPNPAKDRFFIKSDIDMDKIQLLNSTGQIVLEKTTSENKIDFNVAEFEQGIYFVKVFSHDNVLTKKLVIE